MKDLIAKLRFFFRPRYRIIQRGNGLYYVQTYSFIYQWHTVSDAYFYEPEAVKYVKKLMAEDEAILRYKEYTVVQEYL
jgi:hypothetical protein